MKQYSIKSNGQYSAPMALKNTMKIDGKILTGLKHASPEKLKELGFIEVEPRPAIKENQRLGKFYFDEESQICRYSITEIEVDFASMQREKAIQYIDQASAYLNRLDCIKKLTANLKNKSQVITLCDEAGTKINQQFKALINETETAALLSYSVSFSEIEADFENIYQIL